MERCDVAKIAGAVILPNLGGIYSSRQMRKNLKDWYPTLNFPSCKPPNWVLAPMWTSLYSTMGYASYLVWKQGGGFHGEAKIPLTLYASQLALNWAWSPIFFGKRDLKNSAIEIVVLTAAAAATGMAFHKIDRVAGLIFVPYVAWLSFASFLNYKVYKLNPDQNQITAEDDDDDEEGDD